MREPLRDPARLSHMLEMASLLEGQIGCHTQLEIESDRVLFYGLSKMIEIFGEAAYKITKEFKATHPHIPWRQIEGMRHILVHGYFSISPELLLDVITNEIPPLIPIIRYYLEEFE